MIRGNHIHLSVLGAMQVAENGDIANWKIPANGQGNGWGYGPSCLIKQYYSCHDTYKQVGHKLLKRCTLPITGGSGKKIVTDLAVVQVTSKGFKLTELAPGVSEDEVINSTDADLFIDKNLKTMVL